MHKIGLEHLVLTLEVKIKQIPPKEIGHPLTYMYDYPHRENSGMPFADILYILIICSNIIGITKKTKHKHDQNKYLKSWVWWKQESSDPFTHLLIQQIFMEFLWPHTVCGNTEDTAKKRRNTKHIAALLPLNWRDSISEPPWKIIRQHWKEEWSWVLPVYVYLDKGLSDNVTFEQRTQGREGTGRGRGGRNSFTKREHPAQRP